MGALGIYLFVYILFLIVGSVLLSFETSDFASAFTACLTCLSNVGPGLGQVGPTQNFSFFSGPMKILLSFTMLAGRLELYPMLVLFAPSMWKK